MPACSGTREPTDTEAAKIREWVLANVRGTVQADILKEDQGQNTCIFSTEFSLKVMGDIAQYFVHHNVRNFYSVSISGYHIAEAGANPISQLAFTLSKDGNPEIYSYELASRQMQRLTSTSAIDTEATWSPDGGSIVFTSDRGGSPQIYRVPGGGGDAQRVGAGVGAEHDQRHAQRGDERGEHRPGRDRALEPGGLVDATLEPDHAAPPRWLVSPPMRRPSSSTSASARC